jgi:choline dehydrogenase-like flavoprotein
LFDAIIVGSGPAGTFCASELRGRNVLVVDVGFRPARIPDLGGNLYDLRRSRPDMFDDLIGSDFEGLHNTHRNNVSLKLKSPGTAYVIRDWEKLSPIVSSSFEGMMSFAQGGLANVWGAGVYRFNSADLEGFPLGAEELAPYYDSLTEHIGVSGTNDDLVPYFGADSGLMPPVRITRFAEDLLRQYEKKRQAFKVQGITMGLPRLAV